MSNVESLKGKRILITSYSYASFGGAELNAVELADQLVQFGMKPTFFSYDISGPLKDHIEERFDTKVMTDQIQLLTETEDEEAMGITQMDIGEYDYIWVGGNVVPISILRQISVAKELPKFLFVHMSPLVAFPLDAPLMPEFEKKIASKILSISKSTTEDNIQRILGADTPIGDWKNPVPKEFKSVIGRGGRLNKVAVISSSHPSAEILGIKEKLEAQDIEVEYIGRFNDNVKVVDADFYGQYDLIVGIGKNARYSLVSGVPIYIYGRFGGGGYVNEDNIGLNETYNFSGRGFGKKDADTIASEIVSGYDDALKFHESHRRTFIKEMSIDHVAAKLFSELEKSEQPRPQFEDQYINWLVSMQISLMQWRQSAAAARNSGGRIKKLEQEIDERKSREAAMKATYDNTKSELRGVYGSRSWKITKPVRAIAHIIRMLKGR